MSNREGAIDSAVLELSDALKQPDSCFRRTVFKRFAARRSIPTESISLLRVALSHQDDDTVRAAACALGKLGAAAQIAMDDLFNAAARKKTGLDLPQAYPDCIDAMVRIDSTHEMFVSFIEMHAGLSNWHHIKSSIGALRSINSSEALALMHRMIVFWSTDFDSRQRNIIEAIARG